ncbi:MAG TPA: glycosyltransferase family 4 protein [Planctomycetes bacterium]|nr:glycosyltransferase family 4 protein [Planctomycetota bacterium]HIJ70030.1 glycosyltransferase family 4 protein [Planctomycetota bacterium]
MRIVHIITRLILGGAQENTLITCKLLAERGHDVTLITGPALGPEGALFQQALSENYRVVVINKMRRAIHPLYDAISYLQIKMYLKRIQPDIVHTHSAKAGILGRYAAHSLKGKPGGKGRNVPRVVHTIHGLAFHPYQSDWLNKFYIAIEKAAAHKTDAFISVADAMTEKAVAAGLGKTEDFTTAYSAIDEADFLSSPDPEEIRSFRRKYGIGRQAIVLVTIGRLFELKGHEYIIESARRLAPKYENLVWLFVGDGKLAGQIKSDIHLANLGYKFRFTGLLGPEQIPLAIHASDILVHCSLREGLARVLPQAMLCAKPVVSFDIDGAKEVVSRKTGFLVEPENIEQLTQACEQLVTNPELRIRLGQSGREFVKEQFAPETMVDTIEQVYQKLTK